MNLKVAYILKMYPRFSETFIVNEILELERQGVDVRIYSLRKPDDGRFHPSLARVKAGVVYVPQYPQLEMDRIQPAHDRVRQYAPAQWQAVRDDSIARGHEYALKRFLQAGYVAAHLLEHPVDAVHAHFASSATRVAGLVQRLTGIPFSFTAHAKDIYHEDVQAESLRGKMRAARFVVTVSEFNRNHLAQLSGVDRADVRCLYNGVDLDFFQPDSHSGARGNLILGVGRLVEKKGFNVLIAACAILAARGVAFQCAIVGKGPLRDQLSDQIVRLSLDDQVQLLGPRTQDEVRTLYRDAALFALPCIIASDGNRDGLPTVLLEALASGLPAVSTYLTGVPEIIDHGENGLVVPAGNAHALADALEHLLHNPARRKSMAVAARRKVEETFDVQRNVSRLHQWLSEPAAARFAPAAPSNMEPAELPALPAPALIDVVAAL